MLVDGFACGWVFRQCRRIRIVESAGCGGGNAGKGIA
jgi:hypothetical protein